MPQVPQVEHISDLDEPDRAPLCSRRSAGVRPRGDRRRYGRRYDKRRGRGARRLLSAAAILSCALASCVITSAAPCAEAAVDPITAALGITNGDSALAVILRAVEDNPGDPMAGDALARAAFIAYCSGDADRAQQIFEMAGDAGYPQAPLWRGIALLSAGDPEAAARSLREAYGESSGRADRDVTLAMAAAKFAEGDKQGGEVMCRGIMEEGDLYSAAALGLLMRWAPDAVDPDEASRLAELIAGRYPLSYEASLAMRLAETAARAESEAAEEDEIPMPEEELETAPEGGEPPGGEESAPGEPPAREGGGAAAEPGRPQGGGGPAAVGVPEQRGAYSVQVGAFSDVRNAESLVQSLIEKRYEAVRVERESRDGMLFHCVRVGRFESKADAQALASTLEEKEGLGTRIVRKEGD